MELKVLVPRFKVLEIELNTVPWFCLLASHSQASVLMSNYSLQVLKQKNFNIVC